MSMYELKTMDIPLPDHPRLESELSNERTDNFQLNHEEPHSNENDERKKMSVKGILLSFTQEAGVTGIRFIGNKTFGCFRRCFWSIIVLLALSGLLYQVSTLASSFIGRPVNVNIRYAAPTVKPDFPAVTICNNNLFRYNSLVSYLGGASNVYYLIPYLYMIFPVDGESFFNEDYYKIDEEDDLYGGHDLLSFMDGSAHPVGDMIRRPVVL
ncbi:uncharacterized protein LOC144437473 [Glandiceps talaboti]